MTPDGQDWIGGVREVVESAATDQPLSDARKSLVIFTSEVFEKSGRELQVAALIMGPDRKDGVSPFNNGSDEAAGVALVLLIAHSLIAGCAALFWEGNAYAAAALLRQIVEVEYLAWAFDARDQDAERWLRSDKHERETFFSPRKLREAANGRFRGKDYGYHCELGGHPVPGSRVLLNNDVRNTELLAADLLGHSGRIWDHLISWSEKHPHGLVLKPYRQKMLERYLQWKKDDPLAGLPLPP